MTYVVDQIIEKLVGIIKKKSGKGSVAIKPFQIKNHIWVFINCLVENPSFDSQTKENMTLRIKDFGSDCILGEKFVKGVLYRLIESKHSFPLIAKQSSLRELSSNHNI